jgi:hypothetical protein
MYKAVRVKLKPQWTPWDGKRWQEYGTYAERSYGHLVESAQERPCGLQMARPLCGAWMSDMELRGLVFALLGFNLSLVNPSFLFFDCSILELECLLCAIVSWKYVVSFWFYRRS